jgi:hypothetical protein
MKLSVIVPSIRMFGLPALYESIMDSFEGDFEMIVAGPHPILWPLSGCKNIKVILTKRSPNAAQQEAFCHATGEYISFASDDGQYLPGALDEAINAMNFATSEDGGEFIIVGKYLEGDTPNPDMEKDDYYRFKYHKTYRIKGVPQQDYIFNCGIIRNSFIRKLGGWDAENFEATTMAHADLGIRAKKAGARMLLMPDVMFKCSHEPGKTGSHAPIHFAMQRDIKNFQKIYAKLNDRINIELDNWQHTPEIWNERFK